MSSDFEQHTGELQAAAQIPPNIMLLRMENETIMAAAHVQPRDTDKILGQLVKLIDSFPASADEAIYRKPVGSVMRVEMRRLRQRIRKESARQRGMPAVRRRADQGPR